MVVVLVFQLSLPFWATAAIKFTHENFFVALPIAVIVQFIPIALIIFTTDSNSAELELLSSRRLYPRRFLVITIASLIGTGSALAAGCALGTPGSLPWTAPASTFAGMLGLALLASLVVDRRLAGLVAIVPIIIPMAIDPSPIPGSKFWSFITPEIDPLENSIIAVSWLAVGILGHTFRRTSLQNS
jgi:hypothetical protein